MERFYIITEESEVRNEYLAYEQNIKDVNGVVKPIMDKYGIESSQYCIDNDSFAIIATKSDLSKYLSQFKKDAFVGHPCFFKKSAPIYKELFTELSAKGLKVKRKPMLQFCFGTSGKSWSRLFSINGIVYASYQSEYDVENPKGFKEIKASEFYKVVEDYNESLKKVG